MYFDRMIATNPEIVTPEDNPIFIYQSVARDTEPPENLPANMFAVGAIVLLANGWVRIEPWDNTPTQCFPPWRVIALEDVIE